MTSPDGLMCPRRAWFFFHDMTHSHVWHDSSTCVISRIHICDKWVDLSPLRLICFPWHDSFTCVVWLIHVCEMTHPHVWHDSWICVTSELNFPRCACFQSWHDSFTRVTWLIHTCDMTHSHVWYDSFTCVTWHIHVCDMNHSHVWHDLFTCVRKSWLAPVALFFSFSHDMTHPHGGHETCLIHMRDNKFICPWHDPSTCVAWLIHTPDNAFIGPRCAVIFFFRQKTIAQLRPRKSLDLEHYPTHDSPTVSPFANCVQSEFSQTG